MNVKHSPTQSQQAAQQLQAQQTPQSIAPASAWNLPNEISLQVLRFVGDEPVARVKMRGVSKWFDQLVDDNSFWRTFAPNADVVPRPQQRRSDTLPAP
ncbi:MAG: F-box protein [Oxalobacteraceae bacterium]|nr:MAG: F-box protein [Oxalobacteraceae bacterium]